MFLIKYQVFYGAKTLKSKNLSGIQLDFVFIAFIGLSVCISVLWKSNYTMREGLFLYENKIRLDSAYVLLRQCFSYIEHLLLDQKHRAL